MNKFTLITVLGWEDRFSEGFNIVQKEYEIEKIILICFDDYLLMENMQKNRTVIEKYAEDSNINLVSLILNYNNSVGNWIKLEKFFLNTFNVRYVLNITTIPRETIWTILFFLKQIVQEVDYIYFKPLQYDKDWLTKNHKKPRLLLKHSGIFNLNQGLTLFVITGFDSARLQQLIEYYEPNKVILFSQKGSQFENDIRCKSYSELSESYDYERKIIEIDSYNMEEATKILYNEYLNYKQDNIILDSQGPKLSSLSSYNLYLKSEFKIALAYVSAKDFNQKYSTGTNSQFIKGTLQLS